MAAPLKAPDIGHLQENDASCTHACGMSIHPCQMISAAMCPALIVQSAQGARKMSDVIVNRSRTPASSG